MRIKIVLRPSKGPLVLPLHYNYLIQSMIYRHLEKSLAEWLHNEGFKYEKRKFKLFTFSRLMGRRTIDREKKVIAFDGRIVLKIGSPFVDILESFVGHLVRLHEITLGGQRCIFEAVEVEMKQEFNGPVLIRMISPVTVYSTFQGENGKKKTYYYNPWEEEFGRLILENLKKKVIVFNGNENLPPLNGSYIRPVKVSNKRNLHVIIFKGTVIEAWSGIYELNLSEPYISMAYYAGLGSKNSQGFGMWEVVDGVGNRKKHNAK